MKHVPILRVGGGSPAPSLGQDSRGRYWLTTLTESLLTTDPSGMVALP
jgi:hypothetical protein